MQTSLVRENEVVALNRFFYLDSVWGHVAMTIKVAIVAYGMFSTVLLLSLLLSL